MCEMMQLITTHTVWKQFTAGVSSGLFSGVTMLFYRLRRWALSMRICAINSKVVTYSALCDE